MMKYFKGWSSRRGRSLHLMETKWATYALCGAPIRHLQGDDDHLFKDHQREICDHCQRVERKRAKQ